MSERSQDWRDAADPHRSAWVSANAGAGKTHTLANRVTRLLLDGARPAKILCLTFTKAAAAEMQDRLFKQLGEWSMLDGETLKIKIAEIGGGTPDASDLRKARRLFAQALETPGGLKIQTLHAFCERLLSRFPLEAGVPPAFRVLDDQTSREMIANARTEVLQRAGSGDAMLAKAAADLATHAGEQSVLEILRGALGADRGKLDGFLAGLPQSENAIEEALAHVHGIAPGDTVENIAEGFCADLKVEEARLREAIAWLASGSKTDQTLAQRLTALVENKFDAGSFDDHALALLTKTNEIRKKLVTDKMAALRPDLEQYITNLAASFYDAKQRCLSARAAALAHSAIVLASAARRIYTHEKKLRGVLDYSDLIVETVTLLERGDAAAWVLYKLDEGLDHILIDEAQDTSPEQWRIVRKLTDEFFAGYGAKDGKIRTVFAVGDEKQSIFSFQGADPAAFGRNRDHFAEYASRNLTDLQEVDLATSRRSTHEILDFVDAVFRNPAARDGLTSDEHLIAHTAYREGAKGRVEFWPLTEAPDREEPDYWMLPLDVPSPNSSVRKLANEIALRIRNWTDGKTTLPGHDKPIVPGDIMILMPRREPFASEIIKRLKELRVPVAGADRIRITEQIGVMDLIALSRFVLLAEDDLNLAALLRSPLIGFSDEDLFDLANPRKSGLWNELIVRRADRAVFANAHHLLSTMLAHADFMPPHDFYAQVLIVHQGRQKLLARLGPEAADAIDEFVSLALSYEALNTPSLEGFLHWIERGDAEIKRDMDRGRNEVRVMTVHGAKGLEADIVILPDTTRPPAKPGQRPNLLFTKDGAFYPVSDTEAPAVVEEVKEAAHREALREYRRLLYVALTRAKDRLCICGFATGKTKLNENSWYSLARQAAEELGVEIVSGEQTIRVIGDEDTQQIAGDALAASIPQPLPDWALTPPKVERVRPRLLRPSDAAGLEEPATISPLDGRGAARFRRGLLVHALLARLPDIAPERRRDIALGFLAANNVAPEEAENLATETLAVLSDPTFAAAFAAGSRAEVAIVADLPELGEGARLNGRIDRLAVTEGEVLAIDFKTNRPPPARPEDVSTLYLAQMALYRAALAKVFPGKRIACALLWTEGPRLMRLPEALLDAEIARIRARLDSPAPAS